MQKKRVFGIVVVLLIVLLLRVGGEEQPVPSSDSPASMEEAERVAEIRFAFSDCCGGTCGCEGGNVVGEIRESLAQADCGAPSPRSTGCNIRVDEYYGSNGHRCAQAGRGSILTPYYQDFNTGISAWVYGDCTDCIDSKDVKSQDGNEYICSDDLFWKRCSSPQNEGKVTWVSNMLYKCLLNDELGIPTWEQQPGTDVDHDGITTTKNDCDDNPADDPPNCPETPADCAIDPIKNAQCAVCINPSAAEVCGDGINNDCNADTSDNCHQFAAGCEGTSINEQLHGASSETPPEPGTETEAGEVSATDRIPHTNIYGQQFSWTETDDGGYCCGYDGINGLGNVVDSFKGKTICLNKNDKVTLWV